MVMRDGDALLIGRGGQQLKHTGSAIPYGNSAERPAGALPGYVRYNGQTQGLELMSQANGWARGITGLDCVAASQGGLVADPLPAAPGMTELLKVTVPAGTTNVFATAEGTLMPLTTTLGANGVLAYLALFGNYVGEPEVLMAQKVTGSPALADINGMPLVVAITGSFRNLDPVKPLEVKLKAYKQDVGLGHDVRWAAFDPALHVNHWSRGLD